MTIDDGSGIVHLAPAFGEDDRGGRRAEGLPVLNPVDATAAFDERGGPLGRTVREGRRPRPHRRPRRPRACSSGSRPTSTRYPHCWRCGTPLIYWAKPSWFVRTSEQRDVLLRENERIGWHPEHIKHGRFGKWLEGNVDWALSRDRYWGTPLPIWRCDDCGHDHCVGSVAELSELAGRDLTELDLHRPHVDDVTFACPTEGCGGHRHAAWRRCSTPGSTRARCPRPSSTTRSRTSDDVRAARSPPTSSARPSTRPAAGSTRCSRSTPSSSTPRPYRNVVCLALIVDEHGQKMSKSRGNVIAPFEIFDSLGADALRWYFFSSGSAVDPAAGLRRRHPRVHPPDPAHALERLLVLRHLRRPRRVGAEGAAARRPSTCSTAGSSRELDETVAAVTDALEGFDALRRRQPPRRAFVDDLSNWYVRRSRPRFWKASDPAAHATLHECLVTVAQLLAPFCPFLADEIHTTLTGATLGAPLRLARAPAAATTPPSPSRWRPARRLVALGRAARTDAKVKVRQPLSRALLLHPGIELDAAGRRRGPRGAQREGAGAHRHPVGAHVAGPSCPTSGPSAPASARGSTRSRPRWPTADGSALRAALERDGSRRGRRRAARPPTTSRSAPSATRTSPSSEDEGWAVALDLELDDALRAEGTARELVRALNEARKAAGLEIADRIRVTLDVDDRLRAVVDAHRDLHRGRGPRPEVARVRSRRHAPSRSTAPRCGEPHQLSPSLD